MVTEMSTLRWAPPSQAGGGYPFPCEAPLAITEMASEQIPEKHGQTLLPKSDLLGILIHVTHPSNPSTFWNHNLPGGSDSEESACNAGDLDSILGSGRCPRKGNGYPLQYSCLENSTDRGAWWATVHGVSKSQTRLSPWPFHFTLMPGPGGSLWPPPSLKALTPSPHNPFGKQGQVYSCGKGCVQS